MIALLIFSVSARIVRVYKLTSSHQPIRGVSDLNVCETLTYYARTNARTHKHTRKREGVQFSKHFYCGSGWHSNPLMYCMGHSQGHTGQALTRRLQHQLTHTLTQRHKYACRMTQWMHTCWEKKNEYMMSRICSISAARREKMNEKL